MEDLRPCAGCGAPCDGDVCDSYCAQAASERKAEEDETAFRSNFKAPALMRQVAKFNRKQARAKVRESAKRKEAAEWTVIRKAIYQRDMGLCRACGREVKVLSENPLLQSHCHHIVYLSAGGTDARDNLVTLCAVCHAHEHAHVLRITGHGDARIDLVKIHPETGRVLRAWESEVPR